MTGSHSRLAAVQAVVVALLLVLVFATLLQPEDEGPIEAVQGPAGQQSPTALPGPDVYTANPGTGGVTPPTGGTGGTPGPAGGPGGAAVPGAPGGPGAPTGTEGLNLTDPEVLPPDDETRPDGDGGPGDDQYLSALGRLTQGLE